MTNATSPPSPGLRATRSRPIRDVPGFASFASFASPAPHDSCNAMRSGAVRCNPGQVAMTQPVTQTARWRSSERRKRARCAFRGHVPRCPKATALARTRAVSPTSPHVYARRVPALPAGPFTTLRHYDITTSRLAHVVDGLRHYDISLSQWRSGDSVPPGALLGWGRGSGYFDVAPPGARCESGAHRATPEW